MRYQIFVVPVVLPDSLVVCVLLAKCLVLVCVLVQSFGGLCYLILCLCVSLTFFFFFLVVYVLLNFLVTIVCSYPWVIWLLFGNMCGITL